MYILTNSLKNVILYLADLQRSAENKKGEGMA